MTSAQSEIAAKMGSQMQQSGGHTKTSLQLEHENNARQYAETALKQRGYSSQLELLKHQSVIKLIEYLRHRNADCAKTIVTYIGSLWTTLKILKYHTPDSLVEAAKAQNEDQFEQSFLDLDNKWIEENNGASTRIVKWAILKTFLRANGVRKVGILKCRIQPERKTRDFALTREDCRRILNQANTTEDKLVISLLIESLQRIGTISQLTWGDVQDHLAKNEETFLIWINAARTKCKIEHWMPIGPLSSYYMRKLFHAHEIPGDAAEVKLFSTRLVSLMQRIRRIMHDAGVLGRKQGQGHMTRYEKHIHSFRKFGKVEMQHNRVNEDVINYLMGHKRDTYSEWGDRYDELLEIYRENRPRLDEKDTLTEIVEYAKSRGYSLDPSYLRRIGEIRADTNPYEDGCRRAEASTTLSISNMKF